MDKIMKKIITLTLALSILISTFSFAISAHDRSILPVETTNPLQSDPERVPVDDYVNLNTVNSVQSGSVISNGVYRFKNAYNSKYMDTNSGGTTSGTSLVQWDYSPYINGDINEPNRNQLFKITFVRSSSGEEFYTIRPMTNSGMGVETAMSSSSESSATIEAISTTDSWSNLLYNHMWRISISNGYYIIQNGYAGTANYLSCPVDFINGGNIHTQSDLGISSKWILEEYDGDAIEGIKEQETTDRLIPGEYCDFKVCMYSSTPGQNGPVTYSVVNSDGTTTNKATINSSSGYLSAINVGDIRVRVTYPNAPFVWLYNISIDPSIVGTYFFENSKYTTYYMQINKNATTSSSGAALELREFSGWPTQKWELEYIEKGYYKIISSTSGMAISAPSSLNSSLTQTYYSNAANQKWRVTFNGDGTYKFSPLSNLTSYISAGDALSPIVNGRDVELRAIRSDSKDEWILTPLDDYTLMYIGEQNGDPLMPDILNNVDTALINAGMTGNSYTYLTTNDLITDLLSSTIFSCITHGEMSAIDTSDSQLTVEDINELPYDAFQDLELVVLGACWTGLGGSGGNNLVNAISNHGAGTTIGFTVSVSVEPTNLWIETFMTKLAIGCTVARAMDIADEEVEISCETDFLDTYSTTQRYIVGSKSIRPCR